MNNPIASAIKQICDEKNIPQEYVIEALETALAAAFRKDFGKKDQNIKVEFDVKTGESVVYDVKTVVHDRTEEELAAELEAYGTPTESDGTTPDVKVEVVEGEETPRFNPKTEIMLSVAREIKSDVELGEVMKMKLEVPSEYGRMAAQTAKQVIIQKLREAEREILFHDFKDKEGQILIGTVQRREEHRVLVDLGRVTAIMPASEQIAREPYNAGDRVKVYVVSVSVGMKGTEIVVSRSHPGMLRNIFAAEIPEVGQGVIELKGVARDPGARAKVAVISNQENIDPIGSCIGQRGSRIQTIIAELGGEKIDVIQYSDNDEEYIVNALSPAKVEGITLNKETKTAKVKVKEDQLSLAIGRSGQNVRLASRLTGWNIEVVLESGSPVTIGEQEEGAVAPEVAEEVVTEVSPSEETVVSEVAVPEETAEEVLDASEKKEESK